MDDLGSPGQSPASRQRGRWLERLLLVALTFYGLALVVPDYYRLVRQLGSFGLTADNAGLIFDVQGPWRDKADSPAWQAGLRVGDRLDLRRMRCIPVDTTICATILSVRGGQQMVLPGRSAEFAVAANADHPARDIALVARQRPTNWLLDIVTFLDQTAGVLVVLGSAWLVWIRPGAMTWGFFIYAIQFNPGQEFEFYARLQQWPVALLAQQIADCLLQAAGFAGFILFALRAPNDQTEEQWRRLQRALPSIAAAFCVLTLFSLASAFGVRTETLTRAGLIGGFLISPFVVYILLARRKYLSPQDHQRMRWIIWGCLIGLPACMIAEIAQGTSLSLVAAGDVLPEDVIGLLYLVNGVLCLFVIEAIRRPRVINVSIPLRRATVLALILSAPALFLHEQVNGFYEIVHLPTWAWFIVAWIVVFAISRLHEHSVRLLEEWFDIGLRRAEKQFAKISDAILRATSAGEIDKILVDAPLRALKLTSSAVFRQNGAAFSRTAAGIGWTASMTSAIDPKSSLLAVKPRKRPFEIDPDALDEGQFPSGPRQPVIATPVSNPLRFFAVALYGSHESGADLDNAERGLIGALASTAAVAYAQAEAQSLREKVAELERELSRDDEPAARAG